ncbi:winged helix-turn-helix domain-containing protein [Paenibacillus sp.]|uniref:winged helix-turn-helix domain-containing protein n=1 Tax=Paenibacillus sp. TaxID=58172 RepID=UPI0028A8B5DF|nr:winged helix-turn-helix domain-containing protein [Paenibacillus sp.]
MDKDTHLPIHQSQVLTITPEQSKLLESALRIKIMHSLADQPLTSKQVADMLGKTPGNIHYHVIKLFEGGLLELVRTEVSGGIMQKFYRSLATAFRSDSFSAFQFATENKLQRYSTRLTLSPEELEAFHQDMLELITAWESKVTHGAEYGVEVVIGCLQQAEPEVELEANS